MCRCKDGEVFVAVFGDILERAFARRYLAWLSGLVPSAFEGADFKLSQACYGSPSTGPHAGATRDFRIASVLTSASSLFSRVIECRRQSAVCCHSGDNLLANGPGHVHDVHDGHECCHIDDISSSPFLHWWAFGTVKYENSADGIASLSSSVTRSPIRQHAANGSAPIPCRRMQYSVYSADSIHRSSVHLAPVLEYLR